MRPSMAVPRTLALFPPEPALPEPHRRDPEERRGRPAPRPGPVCQPPGPAPRPRARAAQLWVAIHLARLSLDSLARGREANDSFRPDRPLAIVDPDDRVQSLLACNAAARARGVRPGQPLNAALALEAGLVTLPRDARCERELLERIAAWCHRFTPLVSLSPPDELLLEVNGSLRLFGGARPLMECIARELRARGLEVSLALAPTPRSALWLSRSAACASGECREGALVERSEELSHHLAALPLRCLRWPQDLLERLVSMGVRTVGDLLRLPRAGLARRLGSQWLEDLDSALGRHPEVRRRFRAPERYDECRVPECEIETVAGLEQMVVSFCADLQGFLRARVAAVTALALELKHRNGPSTRIRLGLAAPTSDTGHLRRLLHERLAALVLRAPVISLRLRSSALLDSIGASVTLPCAPQPPSCTAPMADALPRLLERLQARLGRAAVFGVCVLAEHRPERAWRAVDVVAGGESPSARHGERAPRPLWLLPDPRALPGLACERRAREGWRIESGPERIESGWWDGSDIARDYFIARDARGVRSWVFRERRAPHGWYLHGLFG